MGLRLEIEFPTSGEHLTAMNISANDAGDWLYKVHVSLVISSWLEYSEQTIHLPSLCILTLRRDWTNEIIPSTTSNSKNSTLDRQQTGHRSEVTQTSMNFAVDTLIYRTLLHHRNESSSPCDNG